MKWSKTRALLAAALVISIPWTVYLSQLGVLRDAALTITLIIEGALTADLIIMEVQRRAENPDIVVDVRTTSDKILFGVLSLNKTLKDARVRCNGGTYGWESSLGELIPRKDILVGEEPSSFCAFTHRAEWVPRENFSEEINGIPVIDFSRAIGDSTQSVRGAIRLVVKERTTNTPVWQRLLMIPASAQAMVLVRGNAPIQRLFPLSIRVIGEGIERVKDFSLQPELDNLWFMEVKEGEPGIKYGFSLGKK